MSAASTDTGAVARPKNWQQYGACRDQDPEMFFRETVGGDSGPARRVCAACPVRRACLLDALTKGEVGWGIRGGLSAHQRATARGRLLKGDLRALDMPKLPQPRIDLARDVTAKDYARLHKHLQRSGDCLLWTGRLDNRDRGQLPFYRDNVRMWAAAHRVAFTEAYGRTPVGFVAQTCGAKHCCAPAHLTDAVMRADGNDGQRQAAA